MAPDRYFNNDDKLPKNRHRRCYGDEDETWRVGIEPEIQDNFLKLT
jgi:hypothetical protein